MNYLPKKIFTQSIIGMYQVITMSQILSYLNFSPKYLECFVIYI